jgi:hypothetical protein
MGHAGSIRKILTLLISALEVYKMLILDCTGIGASKDSNRMGVPKIEKKKKNLHLF